MNGNGNGGVIESPIARRMGIGNVVRDVGFRAFACRTIFLLECTANSAIILAMGDCLISGSRIFCRNFFKLLNIKQKRKIALDTIGELQLEVACLDSTHVTSK